MNYRIYKLETGTYEIQRRLRRDEDWSVCSRPPYESQDDAQQALMDIFTSEGFKKYRLYNDTESIEMEGYFSNREAAIEWFRPSAGERVTLARFVWTLEIEVDEIWVADGFDFTDGRVASVRDNLIPEAYTTEVAARVLSRPSSDEVRLAQGYEPVAKGDGKAAKP